MPLRDFMCNACGHMQYDQLCGYDVEVIKCDHCNTMTAQKLPSLIGGYQGNTGSGSTRPRRAGSMTRVKTDSPKKADS